MICPQSLSAPEREALAITHIQAACRTQSEIRLKFWVISATRCVAEFNIRSGVAVAESTDLYEATETACFELFQLTHLLNQSSSFYLKDASASE